MEQQMQHQDETISMNPLWGVPAEGSLQAKEALPETFASRPLTRAEVEATNPLIYRLKRNSPVRALALAVLKGEPITDAAPLLETLANPRSGWKSRQVAAWTLGRAKLDAEQQEIAAALLERVLASWTTNDEGRFLRAMGRTLMTSLLITLSLSLFFQAGDWNILPLLLIAMVVTIGVLCSPVTLTLSFGTDDEKANRLRAAAAEALGNLRRPESVGLLLAAHLERNKRVRAAATTALRKVLPTLTPEHYGQLESSVTPNLCRALRHWETTFAVDVAKALGKVGDGRAAAILEQEYSEKRPEVHQAIIEILPVLLERRQREEESGLLLRGTSAPNAPDELLRPSLNQSPDEAHDTLLRATQGDDEHSPSEWL